MNVKYFPALLIFLFALPVNANTTNALDKLNRLLSIFNNSNLYSISNTNKINYLNSVCNRLNNGSSIRDIYNVNTNNEQTYQYYSFSNHTAINELCPKYKKELLDYLRRR